MNKPMGIGGMLKDNRSGLSQWWTGATPDKAAKQWTHRRWPHSESSGVEDRNAAKGQQILNVELYGVFAAICAWEKIIQNRRVIFFIDNTAALACLCKHSAREPDTNKLVRAISQKLQELGAKPWYEWLGSSSNPADWPSRLPVASDAEKETHFKRLSSMGFSEVKSRLSGY